MITKIKKWGNSQGLRLSKELLSTLNLTEGDEVEILSSNERLTITPYKRKKEKIELADLVAEMPADYNVDETDWGKDEGNEIW